MISIFVNWSRESQPLKSHWIKFYPEIGKNFKAHEIVSLSNTLVSSSFIWDVLKRKLVLIFPIFRFHKFIFTVPGKKKQDTPNPPSPPRWLTSPKQPAGGLSLVPKLPNKYLFWGDPGAFPLVPPRLQHGYKAGEDNSSSQDTKNPCKALYVQSTSFLLCIHWRVQVTLAILWPPFVLQDVHVPILLKL